MNGKHKEAKDQIDTVLAVGIRDAQLFYHAGLIALKSKDRKTALHYLKRTLETNPVSDVSDAARRELSRLGYQWDAVKLEPFGGGKLFLQGIQCARRSGS